MSAPHTQGQLQAHHDHGWLVVESNDGELYVRVAKGLALHKLPDARRLAACWNRLEPFTTEQIEDFGYDLFPEQRPQFDRLAAELSATKQQLVALLKALEACTTEEGPTQDELNRARAAITNAGGAA